MTRKMVPAVVVVMVLVACAAGALAQDYPSQPIRIVVKDGYATEITGGASAARLIELLEPHGRDARTVAEFGIGTNDKAILTGVILEDEKVMGTIHIAFGDNKSMGGTVRVASHLDGLVKWPTVWFDDEVVMRDGQLLIG